jgi:hypothetical protein
LSASNVVVKTKSLSSPPPPPVAREELRPTRSQTYEEANVVVGL